MNELETVKPETIKCDICNKDFNTSNIEDVTIYDNSIYKVCTDCKDNEFMICNGCELAIPNDDTECVACNDEVYCSNCADRLLFKCADCDNYFLKSDNYYDTHYGDTICQSCYEDNYGVCSGCDDVFHIDDLHYNENTENDYCDSCYDNQSDNDDFNTHNYQLNKDNETCNTVGKIVTIKRKVGCEIELEIANGDVNSFIDDIPTYCGKESDGSLHNGIEITTSPARLQAYESQVNTICKSAKKHGLEVQSSCGLHVHIDATDFKNKPKKIMAVWNTYYYLEDNLYAMLPESRFSGSYSKSLKDSYNPKLLTGCKDIECSWYKREKKLDYIEKITRENKKNIEDNIKYYNDNLKSRLSNVLTDLRAVYGRGSNSDLEKARELIYNYLVHVEHNKSILKDYEKQLKEKPVVDTRDYDRSINSEKSERYNNTRYHGCNLHSIFYRGTLELRYHSGTADAEKILYWTQLQLLLVDYALNNYKKSELKKIYKITDKLKRFNAFMDLLNISGDMRVYLLSRFNKFSKGIN